MAVLVTGVNQSGGNSFIAFSWSYRMARQHDIEINVMHTLENFRDAYDNESSVVVLEAMANALDAKANRVDIVLKDCSIVFRDNGPGMNWKQFKEYHKISGANKTKGRGIGFAGVGAKVYLAIWKNTVIHTETFGDEGAFASDMRVRHGKPKWDECDANTVMHICGTSYGVKLREKDYNVLEAKIHDIIRDQFNSAMLNGLVVVINGSKLEPWNPLPKFQTSDVAKAKRLEFPITLSVMDEDVPAKYRHVQYQVWGKTVTIKKLEWAADIAEPYGNRVHVLVNAEKCSKHLKLSKNSFKSGQGPVADMYKTVERWIHGTLRKNGYVERQAAEIQRNAKLAKFFQQLFKKPEYEWLNPDVTSGAGAGKGSGTGNSKPSPEKQPEHSGRERKKNNRRERRGGSGLDITLLDRHDDPRDGWLDPETNNFVCNRQHPLYRKYEKNEAARNQRVKSIIFSALIKHGTKKKAMSPADAFDLHRDLMTQAKDLTVL